MKFNLGRIVITNGISDAMIKSPEFIFEINDLICKHGEGEYGTIAKDQHDCEQNERSIEGGRVKRWGSVRSRYSTSEGLIYIVTEGLEQTITTILFTSEH